MALKFKELKNRFLRLNESLFIFHFCFWTNENIYNKNSEKYDYKENKKDWYSPSMIIGSNYSLFDLINDIISISIIRIYL